jgi:hypothetical protein
MSSKTQLWRCWLRTITSGWTNVNFFSLIKIDGTWKIVTKLFAVTGQTPTDEA